MRLDLLRLTELRGFVSVEWRPQPGFNLVTGANGAGKTTLLEAMHLLAHGRSFRGRVRDGLVRQGSGALECYAEWSTGQGGTHRAGLRHSGQNWEARLDGHPVMALADLCSALAVITFEPGSHGLISGGADQRRRFLDWALFHVEPSFLPAWRRYSRALKQRNALLKGNPTADVLAPWDRELAEAGEEITRHREDQIRRWVPDLLHSLSDLLAELEVPDVSFLPGWRKADRSLLESLTAGRERDIALGYTASGPHRADWRVDFPGLPGRDGLSRGQTKLLALACELSQATQFASRRGEWPIVCLDDLGSELDHEHQSRVFRMLGSVDAQVIVTGTEPPQGLVDTGLPHARFHVEHRTVIALP